MNPKIRTKLVPIVEKLAPAARIAERVAHLAVHLQKPTPVGIASMVASGISGLAEQLGNTNVLPGASLKPLISKGQLVRAIQEAGADTTFHMVGKDKEWVDCKIPGARFTISINGSICSHEGLGVELLTWLRQAVDKTLPPAVEIRRTKDQGDEDTYEAWPIQLTSYENPQAKRIMDATLPLLEGGRCILLDGKPGVGKTTLAKIIARDAGLGRTVLLANSIVGYEREERGLVKDGSLTAGDLCESLRLLSPGVVVVDDVDKVHLPLRMLEGLREAAKLVILTANNGCYDEVLDGALMRAGRVDEVFSIDPIPFPRRPPFDRLSEKDWTEVSMWPVAYLKEVEKRLMHRPNDIRLDDLRARLAKKTRSGDILR